MGHRCDRAGRGCEGFGYYGMALFERLNWSGLRGGDLASGHCGEVVIFATDGSAGKTAEHGELAGVG